MAMPRYLISEGVSSDSIYQLLLLGWKNLLRFYEFNKWCIVSNWSIIIVNVSALRCLFVFLAVNSLHFPFLKLFGPSMV